MGNLVSLIGWAVWVCSALLAVTFIFHNRRQAHAGQTFTWTTAVWALFLWILVIAFFLTPSWNKLHLLWLLPATFLSSIILFPAGIPIITPIAIFLTNIFMQLIAVGVDVPEREPIATWRKFARNELGPGAVRRFDRIVLDFLIPDNIDLQKFRTNQIVLSRGGLPIIDENPVAKPTPSLEKFYNPFARPPGFPAWFLVAYPDVASWVSGQEDMPSFFHKFVGEVTKDQLLDKEQHLRHEYLRSLVDIYRRGVTDRLECSA